MYVDVVDDQTWSVLRSFRQLFCRFLVDLKLVRIGSLSLLLRCKFCVLLSAFYMLLYIGDRR